MTTDKKNKYWAFLSYCSLDNRENRSDTQGANGLCWGNWLSDSLKNFTVPAEFVGQINGRGEIIPEQIHPIYRDEQKVSEDASLSADSRRALEESICLIVICSPRSAKNPHINEAVRCFKQLGRGKNILPIVIDGEPNASECNKPDVSLEDECFVPALRHLVLPDGTIDTTRRAGRLIFVDARHGVEKREILAKDHRSAEADLEMAKIHLIALLIGVGFNGLWWREQKRHFFDLAEAQHQAHEALEQVEELQRQLQEAQRQIREAQTKVLESQNLPRDVHGQIQAAQYQAQEAQNQASEAQKQLPEFQSKIRETQIQLEEARHRAHAAESKVLEAQNRAQNTQSQLEEAREQVRGAKGKVLEAQQQASVAQNQVREIQDQTRDVQGQIQAAQDQAQKIQNQSRNARRITKVFALLAVLALLAAGTVASMAWWQRKAVSQDLAKAVAEADGKFEPASGGTESVRQVLMKIGGAEQVENRLHSLDQLAAGIPPAEIPEMLKVSAVIVNDLQRSHFQKGLLIRLAWTNPVSAMTCASAIETKVVNDKGVIDTVSYFQRAVLDNWMKTDLSGAFHWVCRLPDTDFQRSASEKIISWVKSQPDSESKNQALETCINELAKKDVVEALVLAESLSEVSLRKTVIARLWMEADPFAAWEWIKRLVWPSEIMEQTKGPWPLTKFVLNSNSGGQTNLPFETGAVSTATNGPIQLKANE